MKLIIINGPNLNLLGQREPEIYGKMSFEKYLESLKNDFNKIQISYFHSNSEGEIIDCIHKAYFEKFDGIILNAGAYSHYSYAIRDAVSSVNIPVVEVHLSNVFSREEFRQKSVLSEVCTGVILGFGLKSYELAIRSFL